MKKTRLSLYYLAASTVFGGIGFLFMPAFSLQLFQSNGNYGDIMPRVAGLALLALGIFVIQLIRTKSEAMYSTTLFIRTIVLLPAMVWLYARSSDPLFLILIGVVGFGLILTAISYYLDSKALVKGVA
jgi:uncharacterized protein YjeT (DUF2065 family)